MTKLDITFVSDVVCPWCAIGLHTLEKALERFPEIEVTRRVMPFELNPGMSEEGEELVPYLSRKYGMSANQVLENLEVIRQRGVVAGFEFRMDLRTRTYSTRAAHRLMAWAGSLPIGDMQWRLKKQLLVEYFTCGRNPGKADVLLAAAQAVGLDSEVAREVLESGSYDDEVASEIRQVHSWGIQSVPATILNNKYLISGGQPIDAFVQAITQAISES